MTKKAIRPEGWLVAKIPLSPGILVDDTLWVAGTLANDPRTGELVGPGDILAQTTQVLESIKEVIETAGGTMADIVMNQIYIKDLADFSAMNSIYSKYFDVDAPARFCLKADMVRPDFLVEIASVAKIKSA